MDADVGGVLLPAPLLVVREELCGVLWGRASEPDGFVPQAGPRPSAPRRALRDTRGQPAAPSNRARTTGSTVPSRLVTVLGISSWALSSAGSGMDGMSLLMNASSNGTSSLI